jgi:hypothetical protein
LDHFKNELSLQEAEDILVEAKILRRNDWVGVLEECKLSKWSCLRYQLVHEIGHIVDGLSDKKLAYSRLDTKYSPTMYGSVNKSEAFAEAFTYAVYNAKLNKHAFKAACEFFA